MNIIRNQKGLALVPYADDFTGSVDVLEALSLAGLRAALFPAPPTAEELASYSALDAVGAEGVARTMPPEEMDEQLLPVLEALGQMGAPFFHYKICSTFYSSPVIGSIGKAAELIQQVFGPTRIPLVLGVPVLKKFCLFGHLFADGAGRVYRLDRHPTMSVHPITPMDEGDLLVHLGWQTQADVEHIDFVQLLGPLSMLDHLTDDAASRANVVLIDNFDERTNRQSADSSRVMRAIGGQRIEGRAQ